MTAPDAPAPPPGHARASRRGDVVALVLLLAGVGLAVAAVIAGTRAGDGAAAGTPTPTWSVDGVDLDRYAADLLAAADDARTAAGLPAWEPAPCAQPAAAERAAALVGEELVHAALDPVLAACAPLSTVAENLSRAAAAPPDVVEAWLGSAGHRANIEDPTLTQAATACVLDDGQVLCALVLAGP
ncbi:CAP domain-containing protein [Cellulomonas phragmiteti]|uniref:SCP domain-containing protein n=1 Tax=Cellulomonas phragmiteti TaxID=478780 RepID=A0ABQ4DHG2_9CELL|nr:CAP domain-containing protein [Cellulomonas phragmiteti]GIG38787.1 hypothetical protein Cph01nite_05490 [Cellulomonas phragmiteti]